MMTAQGKKSKERINEPSKIQPGTVVMPAIDTKNNQKSQSMKKLRFKPNMRRQAKTRNKTIGGDKSRNSKTEKISKTVSFNEHIQLENLKVSLEPKHLTIKEEAFDADVDHNQRRSTTNIVKVTPFKDNEKAIETLPQYKSEGGSSG